MTEYTVWEYKMAEHHANDAQMRISKAIDRKRKRSTIYDYLIGQQIKELRQEMNWSQAKVGRIIGVSYQQVQKIEKGENCPTASKILILSVKAEKPLEYFFKTARTHLKANDP